MATELFAANLATTVVTSGGTTAPSGGTSESWTVASSAMFGAAATGTSQFHVADISANSEIITVTNVSGTTWTVTRGAESTTPVAHVTGFTIYQVTTAGFLSSPAFSGLATFAGTGSGTTGAVTTNDITVKPNSGISTSAAMFLDNGAGQVWQFFCNSSGAFGVFDSTNSQQRITVGANQASNLQFQSNLFQVYQAHIEVHDAGFGLQVAEGSNCKQGTAVLNGTTAVVVSNTSVTANSRIFLTINTPGGTPASPYVFARSAGVSFSIKSTGASDTSTVAYQIFEPAA